jgi:predicted nucleic acid-binding protein
LKTVVDTTYLLGLVGISVEKFSTRFLQILQSPSSDFEIAISEITIFELLAKAAKRVAFDNLEREKVLRGIESLRHDDSISKIDAYDYRVVSTSLKLRSFLSDFIDCIILASAVEHADILLTEDNLIHDLKRKKEFKELVASINPRFIIQSISDL